MNTRWLSQATLILPHLFLMLVVLGLTGCGSHTPILARLQNPELITVLQEHCPIGASEQQVRAGLDALEIPEGLRIDYPPTPQRPEKVLLARSFMDRGFWLSGANCDVQFMDISFVFSPQNQLQRTLIFNDRQRYVDREPYAAGARPKRGELRRYPHPIPPPVDPLQGATQIMP